MPEQKTGRSGVIHDIGFRHYEGDRRGRAWITRSLMWETYRGVFGIGRPTGSKIMPAVLGFILLIPMIVSGIALLLFSEGALIASYHSHAIEMAFMVFLLAALAAPYAVSKDLRNGVMPLYLSRPFERADYVWAKFFGLTLGIFTILAMPQLLLYSLALLGELPAWENTVDFAGGLTVALLVSATVSAIALALASFVTRRGAGTAAIVVTFLMLAAMGGIFGGLAREQGDDVAAGYLNGLDPFALINAVQKTWLGGSNAADYPPTEGTGAALIMLGWLVALVGLALLLLHRRYRKVGAA